MTKSPEGAEAPNSIFSDVDTPPTDFDVLNWCTIATCQELADDCHGGDRSRVRADDVFSTTYGMDDPAMAHFTVDVAIRLNALLIAGGRRTVTLATAADQTVASDSMVRQFVATIYNQAMGQTP